MQTDELRAELAELAREVDPFPEELAAIRRRVARRRALLGSIAVVVSIALVVAIVTTTRSSRRVHVAGREKEVATAKLPRIDAVVVLPVAATNIDAERVRETLDNTDVVEKYAPLRASTLVGVLRFLTTGGASLRARVCAAPSTRSYGVELTRSAQDSRRQLTAAIGSDATVRAVGRELVDTEVFMEVTATAAQVAAVNARIARDPDVIKSTFIDGEAALREFKKLFADEPALVENLEASSLPESFRLLVRDGVSLATVAQRFQDLPGVDVASARSNELWTLAEPTFPSDEVEIFMDVRASAAEIAAVQASLVDDATVKAFRFLTKEDAYKEFKALFGDEPTLIEGTDPSALPTSFRVTLRDRDAASDVEQRYRAFAGVHDINTSGSALADACRPLP